MISVKRLLKLNPRAWDVLKLYLDWVSLCAVEKNLANATNEFLWMGSFPDATHFLFLGGRRLRCNNLPVAEFGERCEAQGLVPEGFLTSADGEMIADIPSKGGRCPGHDLLEGVGSDADVSPRPLLPRLAGCGDAPAASYRG